MSFFGDLASKAAAAIKTVAAAAGKSVDKSLAAAKAAPEAFASSTKKAITVLQNAAKVVKEAAHKAGKAVGPIVTTAKNAAVVFAKEIKGAVVACKEKAEAAAKEWYKVHFGEDYGNNIKIKGPRDFRDQARSALDQIGQTPTGKEILKGYADRKHTVIIQSTSDANGYCRPNNFADAQSPTKGTGSTISWNPNLKMVGPGDTPGATVILGHEMVHAYHNATGTNANGPYDQYPGQRSGSARGEERSTVGAGGTSITDPSGKSVTVPDFSKSHPTENSLRDDFGITRRATYYPSNWPGGAPW